MSGYLFSYLCKSEGITNAYLLEGQKVYLNYDQCLLKLFGTDSGWIAGVALLLCALAAYLIGSLNSAVILSKVFHHDDVRKYGSGNAGATNMARTYGKKWGIITFICDGLKAVVAVVGSMLIMGEGSAYIAALFAILGHIFPIYYKFKGGKGVAVAAISILCLNPLVFLILVLIFVGIVYASKYISLGSIIAAFFYPMINHAFDNSYGFISTLVTGLIAVIVIVMHRSNIRRLKDGNENKIGQKAKKE